MIARAARAPSFALARAPSFALARAPSFALARALAVTLAVSVPISLAGCGPKGDRVFAARMASAEACRGDVDKAVALFDEAARGATRAGDAMLALEAGATRLERAERTAEALGRWDALRTDVRATATDKGSAALRIVALHEAIHGEKFGEKSDEKLVWLRAYVNHPAAPGVVRELLLARVSDDDRGALADELLAAETMKPVWPWLRLEKARIAARAGQKRHAMEALEALAADEAYAHGVLFDDALDEASVLALQLGDRERALAILDRAADARESAWFVGSANRPKFAGIFLRRARIEPTPAMARKAYREFLDAMPEAREALEARYELGVLEAEAGHKKEACDEARALKARGEGLLVAKCAHRFCAEVEGGRASEKECVVLTDRADRDRLGGPRAPTE